MKKYLPVMKKTKLFTGVSESEILSMLSCLGARCQDYKKGEYVLSQGQSLKEIIVLAEGNLHIQKDDYWGNRSILNQVFPGDMLGEAYVGAEEGCVLNDVIAVEDSTVLFFDVKRIITTCSTACSFHAMVVQNLFSSISEFPFGC